PVGANGRDDSGIRILREDEWRTCRPCARRGLLQARKRCPCARRDFWFEPRDQIAIAQNLAIESPQDSLILWRSVNNRRDELRFLAQIHRTPGGGRSIKIQDPLETFAPR